MPTPDPPVADALDVLQSLVAALAEEVAEHAAVAHPAGSAQLGRTLALQQRNSQEINILTEASEVLVRRRALLEE
jgi:hypothetical protein